MLIDRDTSTPTAAPSKAERPVAPAKVAPKSSTADETACFRSDASPEFWLERVTDRDRLNEHLTAWEELAQHCIDPNSFYEPSLLLPALEYLHSDEPWEIALVFRNNKRITDPPVLCGFFPLQRDRIRGIRLSRLRPLTNWYCYSTTPLLHALYAAEAWDLLLTWARSEKIAVLDYPRFRGDGPAAQTLTDVLNYRHLQSCLLDRHNRALLLRSDDFETYQSRNIRGHNRRDMRRLRRRLEEQGQLEFRKLDDASQLSYWATSFFELENRGWKGDQGTAVSQNEQHAEFFRIALQKSWDAGQLQMLGLFLNGEPIALKCNLLSSAGSYAWKIAYDESLSKFSPGVQLEQENLRVFHEETNLQWMDSCAIAAHSMINRLWCDRRTIDHLLIPTGRLTGELFASSYPLLRLAKKRLKMLLGKPVHKQR
ncbi:GNAT family N-acetyltransferase [Rubinisphaera sp. JC750]|uniref:GNAT family N-acetyltransferase n=1 Tax=Rubinisphaera sp. JC750 TaxID=2898658 RepID=UPI001F1FDBD5|nr:GNAT family N-acetyltransferase [Rubinisphaera sp. JC750]